MNNMKQQFSVFKILLYTVIFPIPLFIIAREIINYNRSKKTNSLYSFTNYKQNQDFEPFLKSNSINILLSILFASSVYGLVGTTLEYGITSYIIIISTIVILLYLFTVFLFNRLNHLIERKKRIYQTGLAQIDDLEQKTRDLDVQIKLKQLKKEITSLETIFDEIVHNTHSNSNKTDEVFNHKKRITTHYNEIQKYYKKQTAYLDEVMDRIPQDMDHLLNHKNEQYNDLKDDPRLKNQKKIITELYEQLEKYITDFNGFLKENVSSIIDFKKALSSFFIDYLEQIHALDQLSIEKYHQLVSTSFVNLEDHQAQKLILNRPKVLKMTDCNGNSLLHVAVMNDHTTLTTFLLEQNVDVNLKNKDDFTPLHYARNNKNEAIIDLLVKHGAFIEFVIHNLSD